MMEQESIREFLLLHSRSLRNGIFPESTTSEGRITNPLCGDSVEIKIHSLDDIIHDIGFKASSCAICSASASLLTQEMKGKEISTVMNSAEVFEKSLVEEAAASWPEEIKNFRCFEHLRINPSRRMCAVLPWLALKNALKKSLQRSQICLD